MKLVVLASGLVALALAATAAVAADAPLTADQVRATCSADFQKYCPDAKGGATRACIRGHFMSFTKPCRHVLLNFHDTSHGSGAATP
jgi:hypothetical protein